MAWPEKEERQKKKQTTKQWRERKAKSHGAGRAAGPYPLRGNGAGGCKTLPEPMALVLGVVRASHLQNQQPLTSSSRVTGTGGGQLTPAVVLGENLTA